MADPLYLDHDGHYMDNSSSDFLKLSQSPATSITQTPLTTSSDHKSSEGSKRNKYHWNFFNFYNSPSIPETNEDEERTSANGAVVPRAPTPPILKVETNQQPASLGLKPKVKPGSSLSAEVTRQQLTGAQYSNISQLIKSGEVSKYFEANQTQDFALRKSNSFSDLDLVKEPFRERKNSSSSSTSLPPTPGGSPKQVRKASSVSTLQVLEKASEKMRDERTFKLPDDAAAAITAHVKDKKKEDNPVFNHSNDDNALIRRSSREMVSADSQKRGILKDAAKFMESKNVDHSNRNTNSIDNESLLQKIHKWGTSTQMKMTNKDVNAWAPGGF